MKKELPRNLAIFPISVVKDMTNLTARQIRYYEDQGLILPARNSGNQRIFSLNDIDRFLEIKTLIDQGVNIAGIKAVLSTKQELENVLPDENANGELELSGKDMDQLMKVIRTRLQFGGA